MSLRLPSWVKHLDFTIIDLISMAVAFFLAYWLKFGNLGFVNSSAWKSLLVMMLSTNLVITLLAEPYSGIFRRSYWEDVGENLKLALWSFLIICVAFYLIKIGEDYSREMLLTTYISYLLLSLTFKALQKKRLLSRKKESRPRDSERKAVAVTSRRNLKEIEKLVSADDVQSVEIAGFCIVDGFESSEFQNKPAIGINDLADFARRINADEILIMVNPSFVSPELFEKLIEEGLRINYSIKDSLGVNAENQTIGRIGVLRTLTLERYSFGSGQLLYLPIKRILDILLSLIGCVVMTIVAGVVKLCYLASGDTHPILYRQKRIGWRGTPFEMFKFRSMVWDADVELEQILKDPVLHAEWIRDQKLEEDPRVTRIGRFLRRSSLDELPQFINVLRGEMSVVGPRPLVPGELEEHGGRHLYFKVKPGITGWWGCNGRSNIDYRERLELEYYYVRHCSLYLDILCLFRTIVAVIKREGVR